MWTVQHVYPDSNPVACNWGAIQNMHNGMTIPHKNNYLGIIIWIVVTVIRFLTSHDNQFLPIFMSSGVIREWSTVNNFSPNTENVVNKTEQHCSALMRRNNFVQFCCQPWAMWTAKHSFICHSTTLNKLIIFCCHHVGLPEQNNFNHDDHYWEIQPPCVLFFSESTRQTKFSRENNATPCS